MMISIITMMASAVVLAAVTKYIMVQQKIIIDPVYSFALWHLFLFTILLTIFYESRHGFRYSISIFSRVFNLFSRTGRKNALDNTVSRYREKSDKVSLSRVFVSVAITLAAASVLYSELIFFSVVVSNSMNPTLHKGDMILMQNIFVKPEVGDIIMARVPDVPLPVMHRVVSISGDVLQTQGDGNPSPDSWRVTKSQVLGKNVYISGRPVVIGKLGMYFIVDASGQGRTYGPEFNAVARLIQGVKAAGLMIFMACLLLYLFFSIRDARRIRL
jgi:signal peptidase I